MNNRAVLAKKMLSDAPANVMIHRLGLVLAGVQVLTLSAKVVIQM